MERLKQGERIVRMGLKFKGEPPRYGEVAECYNGRPSATDKGVAMLAIRWDDTGEVERGYINGSGTIKRAPLVLPTFQVP